MKVGRVSGRVQVKAAVKSAGESAGLGKRAGCGGRREGGAARDAPPSPRRARRTCRRTCCPRPRLPTRTRRPRRPRPRPCSGARASAAGRGARRCPASRRAHRQRRRRAPGVQGARWGGAARRIAHAVPSMPCPRCARHAVDGTMHAVPCTAQGRGREKGRSGKLASRLDCARVRTSVDVRICSSPLRGYAAAHSHSAECRAPSAAEGSAPVSRGRTYRKIGRGHQCSASRKGSTDLDMRP